MPGGCTAGQHVHMRTIIEVDDRQLVVGLQNRRHLAHEISRGEAVLCYEVSCAFHQSRSALPLAAAVWVAAVRMVAAWTVAAWMVAVMMVAVLMVAVLMLAALSPAKDLA